MAIMPTDKIDDDDIMWLIRDLQAELNYTEDKDFTRDRIRFVAYTDVARKVTFHLSIEVEELS